MSRDEVAPGSLRLVRGAANPKGAEGAELFLFIGDPAAAPVTEIVLADGLELPPPTDIREQPFWLCVLHFNDLHGHVTSATPHGEQAVLSRLVWYARELRRILAA